MIDAIHECMTTRGVHKPGTTTITTRFTGIFKDDQAYRERFMQLVNGCNHRDEMIMAGSVSAASRG